MSVVFLSLSRVWLYSGCVSLTPKPSVWMDSSYECCHQWSYWDRSASRREGRRHSGEEPGETKIEHHTFIPVSLSCVWLYSGCVSLTPKPSGWIHSSYKGCHQWSYWDRSASRQEGRRHSGEERGETKGIPWAVEGCNFWSFFWL